MSETKREPTTVQRPLEWMKFDPVKFALLADGATLEEEGALIRLLRHLWITGPLSESAIKRITRAAFEFIHPLLVEDGDLLTLEVVEEARTYGIRRVNQRVEAGKKSAAKRNERSTTVKRKSRAVQRKSTDGDRDIEGDIEKEVELEEEKRVSTKPTETVDHRVPEITELVEYLKAVNGGSIDKASTARRDCSTLLKQMGRDYPNLDPVKSVKLLIDRAKRHNWHGDKITSFAYMVSNRLKIINDLRAASNGANQPPADKASAALAIMAEMRRNEQPDH